MRRSRKENIRQFMVLGLENIILIEIINLGFRKIEQYWKLFL